MLKHILRSGTLVADGLEDKINRLTEDQINFFLSLDEKPLVFDEKVLKAITEPEVRPIVKRFYSDKKSIQDLINEYNERYNILRECIMRCVELKGLVSIGSLNNGSVVSVIGMFDGKFLEDQTGRIKILTKEKIFKNEVIGVVGKVENDVLIANKIIYPDIHARPLRKANVPAKVLISREPRDVRNVNYVITDKTVNLPDHIAVIQLDGYGEFDVGGLRFLITKESIGNSLKELNLTDEKAACKQIFRRRNLFFKDKWIKDVPDIFISASSESFVENHKGTTLVGMGNKPIVLDLMTREYKI